MRRFLAFLAASFVGFLLAMAEAHTAVICVFALMAFAAVWK